VRGPSVARDHNVYTLWSRERECRNWHGVRRFSLTAERDTAAVIPRKSLTHGSVRNIILSQAKSFICLSAVLSKQHRVRHEH
jgi:hypothetical protein